MSREIKVGDKIRIVGIPDDDREVTAVGRNRILYLHKGDECSVDKRDVTVVEPFYVVDKTYRYSAKDGRIFKIINTKMVGGCKYAWAHASGAGRRDVMITLTEYTFSDMEEV